MPDWLKELTRILADLLEYPVEHPSRTRKRIADTLMRLDADADKDNAAAAKACKALRRFDARLQASSLGAMQLAHLDLFDEDGAYPLYMLSPAWQEACPVALLRNKLAGLFEKDNFAQGSLNQRDYLPLILEYAAQTGSDDGLALLRACAAALRFIGGGLEKEDSPYAAVGACLTVLATALAEA